jgi:dTMP kinase
VTGTERGAGRGFFLVFEGIEGTGKSAHVGLLGDALEERGYTVTRTREPGGTALAEALRDLHLDPDAEPPVPEAELFLILAARAQHVRHLLVPRLNDGHVVLCDRFTESSLAYQGGGRELGVANVAAADRIATGGLRADLVVLTDAPFDQVARRIDKRRAGGGLDRMDQESEAFFRRVHAVYHELAAADPDRYEVVTTVDPKPEVAARILARVEPRLRAVREAGGLL